MRRRLVLPFCLLSALVTGLPAAASAESYGAIAYSPGTGATGWSHSFNSQRSAERQALRGCANNAGDCRIAIWFVNACGALSVGSNGWGAGWSGNRQRAEYEANRSCSRNTYDCRVIRWQCSGAP